MSTYIQKSDSGPANQSGGTGQPPLHPDLLNEAKCRHVLRVVASHFHLPMAVLVSPTRGKREVAFARQLAMYLAHTHYQLPMSLIARAMGRDRSTIGFGIRRIEDMRDDERTDTIINCLELLLINGDRQPAAISQNGRAN